MDAARWERIQALFHAAADLPATRQDAYLRVHCGDDDALRSDVAALLAEDASGSSLLDRGVAQVAREILDRDTPHALPSGEFGPYRITRVLGEGGMGVVYLAERRDLGSVAAIKVLRDAWLSPARRERFATEQRTLAQLNHPSIARLFDADSLPDGTPWFAMEYVEGMPLTDYCRQRRSSVTERLRLFDDVCEAVQHAHRQLVVHRDLKPSNILVRQDGTVKLLDFGISRQLETLGVAADQTRTALRLMTPAYAAPEELRGARSGIHSDVYSLGVVLYELLVGRLPFDLSNRTPAEAETLILGREPERPSVAARRMIYVSNENSHIESVGRAEWADLDVLCLTAMHKDPQRRYRTVEALIRDVGHYLSGEPLEARPDTVRYRLGKFARRNWRPLAAAGIVVATVVSLVAFYTLRLTTARNAAVAEAARTQRIQRFMLNLFQGGDQSVGPADSLRVVTMVDRGIQEARGLDGEPAIQAELYETLGGIYQQLGNFPRADTLLRASLDLRRRLPGATADVATGLVALALLRDAQAEFEEAERLVREALELSRRQLGPAHPAVARATAALGKILEDRGAYDKAIPVLEEAVRRNAGEGSSSSDYRASLTELANTHFYAGHYATSDTLNRRVLELDRAAHGERHPNVADDLINLGAIQFEWGRFSDAEGYYRQALGIIRRWYGDDHPETASCLTMLGRALVSQRRFAEADTMLKEAVAIQEHVYGKVHPRVASALNELGRTAQQRGDLDAAEEDFKRMADIYRKVYNDKHYLIGVALSNWAGVLFDRKQYTRAEQLFREVLARYGEVLAPDHLLVGIARIRLGRTLLSERRWDDAEHELTAGYDIVSRQGSPSITWLRTAREALVSVYDSLRRPEKAAMYKAALTDSGPSANGSARPK